MDTETLSTTIDTGAGPSAEGGGAAPLDAPDKGASITDAVSAAYDKLAEQQQKDDAAKVEGDGEKPNAEAADDKKVKADPEKVDGKGEKEEKELEGGKPEAEKKDPAPKKEPQKPSEGEASRVEAPEKFSPQAKEQWKNVPHQVRAEIQRVSEEASKEIESYKPALEKYESIRRFHDMAEQVGQPLDRVLENYVRTEQALAQNPLKGLNDIIRNYLPAKADGSPMTLQDVALYVNSIGPEALHQSLSQAQMQERQQMAQMQEQQASQQRDMEIANLRAQLVQETITAPFAAKHEHYNNPEVQRTIEMVLKSGIIDASLPPLKALEEAYGMAVLKHGLQSSNTPSEGNQDRAGDFGGQSPQIKSSPGAITESAGLQYRKGETTADTIRRIAKAKGYSD